jgi:hypothetical protein
MGKTKPMSVSEYSKSGLKGGTNVSPQFVRNACRNNRLDLLPAVDKITRVGKVWILNVKEN